MKGMSLEITEELLARQTPEAQAILRALLAKIRQLQEQLNQSRRNSSLRKYENTKKEKSARSATQHALFSSPFVSFGFSYFRVSI